MRKIVVWMLLLTSTQVNAQLQNMDFESCDTSSGFPGDSSHCMFPQGWIRTGTGSDWISGFNSGNGGVADAQQGNKALQISVWYTYNKDMAYQQAPFTSFPESLNGYYKYTDNTVGSTQQQITGPDSARVSVLLSRWNGLAGQRDTIGFGQLSLGDASHYTGFSCPIHYVSTVSPDSILIHLDCSRVGAESVIGSMWGNSSIFTVDNLSLQGNVLGVDKTAPPSTWRVFPNPGNGYIRIPGFEGRVEVMDMNGKRIVDQPLYTGLEMDVHVLPEGMYVLQLTEKSGNTSYVKYLKNGR